MSDFDPTPDQIKAFNKVIKAINRAKKLGLHFYGKQWNLVAYNDHTFRYIHDKGYGNLFSKPNPTLPHLASDVLADSGADDYPSYFHKSDVPNDTDDEDEDAESFVDKSLEQLDNELTKPLEANPPLHTNLLSARTGIMEYVPDGRIFPVSNEIQRILDKDDEEDDSAYARNNPYL